MKKLLNQSFNLSEKNPIIAYLLSFILISSLVLISPELRTQTADNNQSVIGLWEGEFMPGNNLWLILKFEKQTDETIAGSVILFQGDVQIQDDPLKKIIVDNKNLSFLIEAKDTPFTGTINTETNQIVGEFLFPDGSVHPVFVTKVKQTKKGNFKETGAIKPEPNILEKTYSVEELQADFTFLREKLESEHPQLYLFTSNEDFDKNFSSVYRSINKEMTEDDFFRIIAPVVAEVNCCHTGIRFSNEFSDELNKHPYFLPLEIQFINNQAYIVSNYSQNSDIILGMQIESINNVDIEKIKKKLELCIPSDGCNTTSKTYEMNTNFTQVYSLYIGIDEKYQIECINPSIGLVNIEIDGQTQASIVEAMNIKHPERFPNGPLPVYFEIIDDDKIAVLSIKGFWAPNWEYFNAFLQSSFDSLTSNNIQYLIIDVRGNKGGHPYYSAELFSYIANEDFTYFESSEEMGELAPLVQSMENKKTSFDGQIYVLMNGGCLSTTGHFLSLVKYHQLATLIGEESGGSFYCNDGSIQYKLPNTKIKLNLPQITFQTSVSGFAKGDPLLPDFFVEPTLEDILNDKDTELGYTIELTKM